MKILSSPGEIWKDQAERLALHETEAEIVLQTRGGTFVLQETLNGFEVRMAAGHLRHRETMAITPTSDGRGFEIAAVCK